MAGGKVQPVTALVSGAVGGAKWSKRCQAPGRFVLAVTRDGPATVATRSEIFVRTEAPVNPAGLPGPVGAVPPAIVAAALGSAGAPATALPTIAAGASFNDAPVLTTGSYADTLSTGETRFYRVRLGWGQRLAYRFVVGAVAGADHGDGYVRTAVMTPLRREVALSAAGNAERDFGGPAAIELVGSTLVPVEYANRDSGRSDIWSYALAGDYYLSIGMSYPAEATPYRTTLTVTIEVAGTEQGGPTYLPLAPISSSPSTAWAAASGPATGAAASSGGSSVGIWIGVAIGGGLVLAAGSFYLVRRRRATEPQI